MLKELKNFIIKLQNLDELAKRKWLVGLTSITVVLVVILWGFYLSWTIEAVGNPNVIRKPSAWDIFNKGLEVVGSKVETGLANSYTFFYNKAAQGNTFEVNFNN